MSEELRDMGDFTPTPDGDGSAGQSGSTGGEASLPIALSAGRATSVRVAGLAWYVDLDISRLVASATGTLATQWLPVWDSVTGTYFRASLDDVGGGIDDAPVNGSMYARKDGGWTSFVVPATPDLTPYVVRTGDTMTGKLVLPSSTTTAAGLNLGAGVAPTSPVNGDIWATSTAVLARLNGNSRTLAMKEVDNVFTTKQTFVTSSTGIASARIPPGAAPTTPADGDLWQTAAGGLFFRHGTNTRTVQFVETLPAFLTDAPNDTNAYNRKGGAWVIDAGGGGGITDAPSDGTYYARRNAAWAAVPASGITDAPSDGTTYGRLNAAWTGVVPLAGATMTGKLITAASTTSAAGFNITPMVANPTTPANGDMWLNTGALFVRINGTTLTTAFLQIANTWNNKQTFPTSSTSQASILLPHGVAPTTPVNGDVWTTTAGIFFRINAGTYQAAFKNVDNVFTTKQTFLASATGGASINIPPGVAPTGGLDGDLWTTTAGGLFYRKNTTNKTVAFVEDVAASVTLMQDTAPAVGSAGTYWWDSDSGNTYISFGGAWVMVSGPSVAPAFRGCRLTRSTTFATTSGGTTSIGWDQEVFDTSAFHDNVTNPERITIPAGVSMVELTFQADWATSGVGERAVWIADQSGNIYGFQRYASTTFSEAQVNSGPVPVVAGNYFTAIPYQASGGALNANASSRSFFALKVLG